MGMGFWDFIKPKNGKTESIEVDCREFLEDKAQELKIRKLCFDVCVNMIANAIGRCEFRTFRGNKEIHESEYYLWNIEPNVNQNSSMFLHKLIHRLCIDNEALVIDTRRRDGKEALVVADSFTEPKIFPSKQNEYRDVTVGEVSYDKTFRENDVLHFKLNHAGIKSVIDGIHSSYSALISAAVSAYGWDHGQHWKVHVNQIASGENGWEEKFRSLLEKQFKPFINSKGAILPEFDGYLYEDVGSRNAKSDTRDIKALIEDVFDFTARGFLIPIVLVNGKVEATADANKRFLTNCIDPICDQLQEEINRKRYGYDRWADGDFIRVDSSSIIHFDLFENAANVEKLVGSGAYTINDVRHAANQSTINEPWANQHYMTLNIATMGEQTRTLEA